MTRIRTFIPPSSFTPKQPLGIRKLCRQVSPKPYPHIIDPTTDRQWFPCPGAFPVEHSDVIGWRQSQGNYACSEGADADKI